MPTYSGKCQHRDAAGAPDVDGPCRIAWDEETCTISPESGQPLAFDLGDVDCLAPGDQDLELALFNGSRIRLRHFGPAFESMSAGLAAAWRDRTVQCLLLEDLKEAGRFNGQAAWGGSAPVRSEIRIYESNIAVLPLAGTPLQWRLADVDSVAFDAATWSVTLQSPAGRLVISKVAKKTDEFRGKLGGAIEKLRARSAGELHRRFPFLDAGQLQRLMALMPEGRSACVAGMRGIHPKLADALIDAAVDAELKPYFDELRSRCAGASLMAGYKFIRDDEAEETEEASEQATLFFWFFFQLADRPNVVAWESASGSGRATYLFRIPTGVPVEAAVNELTRGLALVNFRREPVYLPDESLEMQARYRRYAIGCRKLPDLRNLRAAFAGRALHTTVEQWRGQLDLR